MNKYFSHRFRRSPDRGVALILTLGILVLITLLVIAFAVSMRVENTASKNFNEVIKARELGQAAIDQVVASLRNATPHISSLTNYVTAPGVVYTWPGHTPWIATPLFTTDSGGGTTNLNVNNWITGQDPAIFPLNSPNASLTVGWSNITVATASGKELVGRFAYWVDDESAKINLNTAGTRGNDLEGNTSAAIDLRQLLNFSTADQINITNYVSTVRSLETLESVKMTKPPLTTVAPGITTNVFGNNQFYMTVNSSSPDITAWGSKRLNLSNLLATASSMPLRQAAVNTIASTLTDPGLKTWFAGQDFSKKYPNMQQIAANIVDYVRPDLLPTESSSSILHLTDVSVPTYLGLKQTPYINEIVVSNSFQVAAVVPPTVPPSGTLTISTTVFVELWYMYTNKVWNPAVLTQPTVIVSNIPLVTLSGSLSANSVTIPATTLKNSSGFGIMPTNSYQILSTVSSPLTPVTIKVNDTTQPIVAKMNQGTITVVFTSQNGRIDYAQTHENNVTVLIPVSSTALFSGQWASQCNDPRVRPVNNNWTPSATSTLGQPNAGILNLSPTTAGPSVPLQGDGDMSCHIVSSNPNTTGPGSGKIYPGELSFIHTGIPWRTFWLQPQPATEAGSIPDWAILELFSSTDATNVIGRMNINATTTNANVSLSPLIRKIPLQASLTNSVPFNSYKFAIAVQNVFNYGYLASARVNQLTTAFPNFSPYSYTMVGEIANTQSFSNTHAVPANQISKRHQETPVRGLVNIATTRSDTFTVWAIAQSIKKVDKSDLTHYRPDLNDPPPTGEVKVQAILERYEDQSTTPPTVKFRTKYLRYFYQ